MFCIVLWAIASLLGSPDSARSEPVLLTFVDLSFSVTGDLIAFDGETYQIDSYFGRLTLAAETVSCSGQDCPLGTTAPPIVKFVGDPGLVEPLLVPLIHAFAKDQGNLTDQAVASEHGIQVSLSDPQDKKVLAIFQMVEADTARSLEAIQTGESSFALVGRSMTQEEKLELDVGELVPLEHPQRSRVIGWQNIHLHSGKKNTERVITISDLVNMMDTPPALWPLADGAQLPVVVIGAEDKRLGLQQALSVPPQPFSVISSGINWPGTLTIVGEEVTGPTSVRVISGCDQLVDPSDVRMVFHPLRVPLTLISTSQKMSAIARKFWSFLLTVKAQNRVQELGFISRTPSEFEMYGADGLLANAILNTDDTMRTEDLRVAMLSLHSYNRMSLIFRFLEGAQVLDAESYSNVRFLTWLIQSGYFERREVVFVGFSDSQGSPDGNLRISLDRARAVRATISTMLDDTALSADFQVIGLGEGLPVACNDTFWGQDQNRRVEIWVK
jgi:phosphate transport system substrate-binding protein